MRPVLGRASTIAASTPPAGCRGNRWTHRRSVVALSARGEALEAELVPLSQSLIAQALVGISPEDIETTTRTLKAMLENLSAAQQSAFSKKDANR